MWMVFRGVAEILVCEKTAVWTFSACFQVQWQINIGFLGLRWQSLHAARFCCTGLGLFWTNCGNEPKKSSHPLASTGGSTCVHVLRQTSKFSPMVNCVAKKNSFFTANDFTCLPHHINCLACFVTLLFQLHAGPRLWGCFIQPPGHRFSRACRSWSRPGQYGSTLACVSHSSPTHRSACPRRRAMYPGRSCRTPFWWTGLPRKRSAARSWTATRCLSSPLRWQNRPQLCSCRQCASPVLAIRGCHPWHSALVHQPVIGLSSVGGQRSRIWRKVWWDFRWMYGQDTCGCLELCQCLTCTKYIKTVSPVFKSTADLSLTNVLPPGAYYDIGRFHFLNSSLSHSLIHNKYWSHRGLKKSSVCPRKNFQPNFSIRTWMSKFCKCM